MIRSDQTTLYRHFCKDELLYVGISINALKRLGQHRDRSHWFNQINRIEMEKFETREQAIFAEIKAIQTENPKFNKLNKIYFSRVTEKTPAVLSELDLLANIVSFDPLYPIRDAAKKIGLRLIDVKRMIERGRMSFIDIDGKIYISGWQLIDFIEASERKQEPKPC